VLVSRDGWLRTVEVTLAPPVPTEAKILPLPDASDDAKKLYEKWLDDPFPITLPAKPPPRG
jgi:hypothetical protein